MNTIIYLITQIIKSVKSLATNLHIHSIFFKIFLGLRYVLSVPHNISVLFPRGVPPKQFTQFAVHSPTIRTTAHISTFQHTYSGLKPLQTEMKKIAIFSCYATYLLATQQLGLLGNKHLSST
jgi:hypothetical protein